MATRRCDAQLNELSAEWLNVLCQPKCIVAYSKHTADDLISRLSAGIKLMPKNVLRCQICIWQ